MICERFTFIIIYLALSGYGWAVKSNFSNSHLPEEIPSLNKLRVERTETRNFEYQEIANQVIYAQKQTTDLESSSTISRRWSVGGMALTSSIALFLLRILFKKPRQKPRQKSEIDQKLATDKQKTVKKAAKVADHSRASMMSEAKSDPVANNLKPYNTDLKPNLDLAENSLNPKELNVQNGLEQAGSITPDIDVVHELIQDLQGFDQSGVVTATGIKTPFSASVRRKAIWELTKKGDYRSIEPLLKIMPQAEELDKSLIVEAVTQISNRSFKSINDELFTALEDPNPEVRLNAVRDLKHLYQFVSPAITKIAQMQSDTDYQVRQTAIQALQQLNASPLPTFKSYSEDQVDQLFAGTESEANLHLVAYLLAELDAKG